MRTINGRYIPETSMSKDTRDYIPYWDLYKVARHNLAQLLGTHTLVDPKYRTYAISLWNTFHGLYQLQLTIGQDAAYS